MMFELAEIKYHLFIPLIYPIFILLRTFVIKESDVIVDNLFFQIFRYYLSYVLSGICILIIKLRTKIHNKRLATELGEYIINTNDWINPLEIQKQIIDKEKKIKNYLFILLLIIIGLLSNISNKVIINLFKENKEEILLSKQSIGVVFKIIYLIFLSKIILKISLYKHQFISLNIIIINLIILIITVFISYNIITILKIILYNCITSLFYCLFDILGKRYLNSLCDTPYQIMLKIGTISIILFLIYDILFFIINGNENSDIYGVIIGIMNNFHLKNILYIILDIIFCFFWNAGIWFTLYHLTPCHFIISESLSQYFYYFIDFIRSNNYQLKFTIIYGIVYILNFLLFLVFDEIIILKFLKLDKNTKVMIEHRETFDTELTPNETRDFIDESLSSYVDEIKSSVKSQESIIKESLAESKQKI